MKKENRDTLCWTCKKCTNSAQYNCCWAEKGKPVQGWTAVKGLKYQFQKKDGTTREVYGYCVSACPEYVRDDGITCFKDAVKHVAKTLNRSVQTVYKYWYKYLKKYEQTTGEKLPAWVVKKEIRTSTQRVNKHD